MPATATSSFQQEQLNLFPQDIIDRKKTRDMIMKQLTSYQPQEGCKKPKISAPYNDLVWTLVIMLNENIISLRQNNTRAYKSSIKNRQFDFVSYKTNIIKQISDRNNISPIHLSTLNRQLKLLQEAGILLTANKKIHVGDKVETSPTTFFFTEKLIILEKLDEPKKALFCTPYSSKKRIKQYESLKPLFNKNIINSDAANSLFEENKRLEKKGAVREKTDVAESIETPAFSETPKSCAKKVLTNDDRLETAILSETPKSCAKKVILNDGTLPGQLWASAHEVLYPTWSVTESSQREATQIMSVLMANVESVLESKFYQRVTNGVEKYKEKQRKAYEKGDQATRHNIMTNLEFRIGGVRQYFIENQPCAKSAAFFVMSRAIEKAKKYQNKKGFDLNIYPTKYLANHFIKAIEWAQTEYDKIDSHRQSESMKQVASARGLFYKLANKATLVRFSKKNPELSQPEAIAKKYAEARLELISYLGSKCQQLTDATKQSLLQEFDAQIAPLLSRPVDTKKTANTTVKAEQHSDTANTTAQHNTANYDAQNEGENFATQDWKQQDKYEKCLRLVDDALDTLRRAPLSVAKPAEHLRSIIARARLGESQSKDLIEYAQTQLKLIL